MCRKKILSASRTKPSPSSTVDQTSSTTPPPSDEIINTIAKRALTILHHGNNTKSQKIIKDSLSKYKNAPILHRVHSEIQLTLATQINDPNTKLKHLKNSVESAQRATTLSPNSLSFSHFYVETLFELSKHNNKDKDHEYYNKLIQECDRGLSIEKPLIEVAFEVEEDSKETKFMDVENIKNEIREYKKRISVVKIIDVVDDDGEETIRFTTRKRKSDLKDLIKRKEKKIYKELEKKMEAARILRRKFELNLGFVACSTSNRLCDRKTEGVRKYWNERMSDERKKRLLEVRIDEVKKYFDKNEAAREVLNEAIGYAEEKGNWKFWECCICGEKFGDGAKGVMHYEEEHIGVLSEKMSKVVPGEVENIETVEMIRKGDWRPVDTNAVVEILKNQSGVDVVWPISDDKDRATALKSICHMFQLLLACGYLTKSLIIKMIVYAKMRLRGLISESQFQIHGLNNRLDCLRFLEASELSDPLEFLREVHSLCDFIRLLEGGICEDKVVDIIEKISFSSDLKCLLLDDRLLRGEIIRDMHKNSVANDGSALVPAVGITCDMIPISDDIIDWLFMNSPIEEQLASWTKLRGDKLGGTEVFDILVTEVSNIKTLCGRNYDINSCMEAYEAVERICLVEVKKMEQFPECEPQVLASLLRERRTVLMERDGGDVFISTQLQLDAIRDVLEEALSLSFNLEVCGKDNDWMMQDCLCLANHYILEAIQRQMRLLFDELVKIDAMIQRTVAAVRELEQILSLICAYDYRSIMLPLLKLFIQAHLEDLVDNDTSEMYEAAQCLVEFALDAKKNTSKGGDHAKQIHLESTNNKKSKDKKKKKYCSKPKEFKATGGNEHPLLDQEDVEPVSSDVPVASPSAHDLQEQEEELKKKIELEEAAREHPAETPEHHRRIEEAEEKRSMIMFGNLAFAMPDKQLDSEVSAVSCNGKSQPNLLVDEIGIPEDSSGVPVNTMEGTMGRSSSVSGTQRRKKRSHSHDKFEQGPPNQAKPEVSLLSGERKECQYSDFKALLTEKEKNEDIFQQEEENFLLKKWQMLKKISLDGEEFGPLPTDAKVNDKNESVVVGIGLKNVSGENNCFLNVIIQALWNLRRFRDEFMAKPELMHVHTGHPCVVCELKKIYACLSISATEMQKEAVDPASFRIALSKLNHSFKKAEMNDASEVLDFIFDFLHQSFTSKGNYGSTWDCATSRACLVHTLFGMNILEETNCDCGHKSRQQQYTSFTHIINANDLRSIKSQQGDSSFDEFLKLQVKDRQLTCDSEEGGCGKLNPIHHILSTPPHFFTAILVWQTAYENVDDISETLRALTTEIDLGIRYPNLASGNKYCLVSVICFYRKHYICFAYHHEDKIWILYDDENVKVIGCWSDVHTICDRGHYQPLVLFFEAVQ